MNASLPEDHQLKGVQIWKDEEGREEQEKNTLSFWPLVCFEAFYS